MHRISRYWGPRPIDNTSSSQNCQEAPNDQWPRVDYCYSSCFFACFRPFFIYISLFRPFNLSYSLPYSHSNTHKHRRRSGLLNLILIPFRELQKGLRRKVGTFLQLLEMDWIADRKCFSSFEQNCNAFKKKDTSIP